MPSDAPVPPITYSIDRARDFILEVWRGLVTADDLRAHWGAFLENADVMRIRRTLVDMREAELQFTGQELSHLVSDLVIPRLGGLDWKTAILVAQPVQFGVSRQYQVFAESYSADSIFYDVDEAIAWLLRGEGGGTPP